MMVENLFTEDPINLDLEQASKMALIMEVASRNAAAVNNSGSLEQSVNKFRLGNAHKRSTQD
jgi:hypothetical protein